MAVGLVVVLAVSLRCGWWDEVFQEGMTLLIDTDPYYHVWRALMLTRDFPLVEKFDPYLSFPQGAHIPWPPGFDWLIALPAMAGGGERSIEIWGTILMPLLGGLATLLTYSFGRVIFGRAVALLAALLFALSSAAAGYSMLGRIDHHALVAPVTLAMYLAFFKSLRGGGKGAFGWGLATAALAAFSVGCWIITPPIYFLPLPLCLLLLYGVRAARDEQKKPAALALLATIVLVAAVVWFVRCEKLPFALYQPSWFTVMAFSLAAVAALPFFLGWRRALAAWAAGIFALAVWAVLSPAAFSPLLSAWKIFSGQDATYLMASESRSSLMFEDMLDFFAPVAGFSYLFNLTPIFLVVFLVNWWRKRRDDLGRGLLAIVFPFSLALMVAQNRFCEYSAPFVFLLLSWILVGGTRLLVAYRHRAASPWRFRVLAALLSALLAFALSPIAINGYRFIRENSLRVKKIAQKTARQLAASVKPPADFAVAPQYGLLAPWEFSHLFLLHARLPVMVSSFGTEEALNMNKIGFSILLEQEEEKAFLAMKKNRLRFLVAVPLLQEANIMARIAGMDAEYGQHTYEPQVFGGWKWSFQPRLPLSRIIVTRLLLCDGSACRVEDTEHLPLDHFRLFLESKESVSLFRTNVAFMKVFEVVEGAKIAGRAEPGQTVRLRLTVESNTGRKFLYHKSTRADAEGRFVFRVPYANEPGQAPTTTEGPYRIKAGDRLYHVSIREQEVQDGTTIELEKTP